MDETVSPIEADLAFAVSKKRREARDFPGAARIAKELAEGAARKRVGLIVLEGAPAREGAEIADEAGDVIGVVTSGGFSPSLGKPIAMGFVPPAQAEVDSRVVPKSSRQAYSANQRRRGEVHPRASMYAAMLEASSARTSGA